MKMILPRLLVPAVMLAALTGCSVLSGSSRDPVTIYAPSVQIKADPSWPQADYQLVIAKPSAARMVDSPRINVRPTPSELEVYKGATWAQPATDMVEETVLRGFEDSGRIQGVARSATGIRADYKLALDVRRFEADYAGQATPTAVIEINAKLVHVVDQRVVSDRTFRQSVPVGSTAVPAVAAALERSLAQATTGIVGWTLINARNDRQTP